MISIRLFFLGCAVYGGGLCAQTISSRSSTLQFDYVYGFGVDTHTGSPTVTDNTLLATDNESTTFTGSASGNWLGDHPYGSDVFVLASHSYDVAGGPTNFSSISAIGSNQATASATGFGEANMGIRNPGNSLQFRFNLQNATPYTLNGHITMPAAQASIFSVVSLEWFDGFTWANINNTGFLPGSQGSFNYSGTLASGEYRLTSVMGINAGRNESWQSDYQYRLALVPEPATVIAIVGSCGFLLRRRRKVEL